MQQAGRIEGGSEIVTVAFAQAQQAGFSSARPARAPARSSRGKEPREYTEESPGSDRGRFHLRYAQAEQIFQGSAETPVLGGLAEPIEVGLAHVALEHQLVRFGVERDPIPQFGWEFIPIREPVELDEVIHETLHQLPVRFP
jgi:hypothetical protein